MSQKQDKQINKQEIKGKKSALSDIQMVLTGKEYYRIEKTSWFPLNESQFTLDNLRIGIMKKNDEHVDFDEF